MRRLAALCVLTALTSGCPDAPAEVDGHPSNGPPSKPVVAAPTTSPSASSSLASASVITASLQGKSYVFPSAFVRNGTQNDVLVLSTAKLDDCSGRTPPDGLELSIELPLGPGGNHYSGQPLATSIELVSEKAKLGLDFIDPPFVTVRLDTKSWVKGDRVKGTLEFSETRAVGASPMLFQGSGPFEAQVCNVDSPLKYPALPLGGASDRPVQGDLGKVPLVTKTAIAWLVHDADANVDLLVAASFHANVVDCASATKDEGAVLRLEGFGGASSKQRFAGAPQPARATFADPTAKSQRIKQIAGPAWIRFDAFELAPGGKAKGAVYAVSGLAEVDKSHLGSFGGTFEATVCKK